MWVDFLLIYAWLYIFLQTSQLGVLSCHVHLLYEKELHKSLSRQVVYSFYEICNGCVALVKLVSLVGIYVYIRSVYITYMYIFVFFLLLTEPSGHLWHLENSIPLYNQYLGNGHDLYLSPEFCFQWTGMPCIDCIQHALDGCLHTDWRWRFVCNRSWNVFSSSLLELQTMRFQVMQLKKRPFDPKWLPSPSYVVFCHLYSWLCLSCPTINKSTSVLKCLSLGSFKIICCFFKISY